MGKFYEINTPAVISEPMEDEVVVINLDNGCYYSLNKTAAQIWSGIEQGHSAKTVVAHFVRSYPDDADAVTKDFVAFINRMTEENLIRETEAKSPETVEMGISDETYLKPDFEKFTDMQEMLLLDPIHEVSEAGWPHQKKK